MSKKQENIKPVYFMDLVVENVRCFKDRQVMDLSDGNGKPARWTIILGDNGTGKTTLLKCIGSLCLFHDYKMTFSNHRLEYFHFGLAEPIFKDIKETEDSLILAEQLFHFHSQQIHKVKFGNNFKTTHTIKSEYRIESFIISYGALRKGGSGALTDYKNKTLRQELYGEHETLINPEAWLLETDFAIKSAKNSTKKYLQKRYIKVKETLKKLLPDVQGFRIKEITKTNFQAAIEVKTPYGWVDMKNLSLGYQTFIAWVVDLAARLFDRYPDSDNPLEEPCIVLVDEIDLHLHPKWQRKIIGFLTDIFKNAQFIVTAHSPLIVQAAENANIVLLKREGDSVRIYNNMDEEVIKGWRIDQVLTSDLFGLDSARPPKYDEYLERKKKILSKDKLTPKDEKELENIANKLEEIPLGDQQANDAIAALKKATAILNAQ